MPKKKRCEGANGNRKGPTKSGILSNSAEYCLDYEKNSHNDLKCSDGRRGGGLRKTYGVIGTLAIFI